MKNVSKTAFGTMLFLVASLVFLIPFTFAVQPFGASVSTLNVSTAPVDAAGNANAFAGNISELSINGRSTTQTWQGYFGNVTGTIQLADGSNNVMYNWTLASPQGEVYASTNSSIQWLNIQCFNYTATGTYSSDTGNAGATSRFGTNLSALESRFNIVSDDVDGLNETFTLNGAGTHDAFFTANLQFTEGECISTRVFDQTGVGVTNKFEEVLLYEPVSTSVVFTALLEEDQTGFNNRANDFQMLVLEDGHSTDTALTPYYFFVELQ